MQKRNRDSETEVAEEVKEVVLNHRGLVLERQFYGTFALLKTVTLATTEESTAEVAALSNDDVYTLIKFQPDSASVDAAREQLRDLKRSVKLGDQIEGHAVPWETTSSAAAAGGSNGGEKGREGRGDFGLDFKEDAFGTQHRVRMTELPRVMGMRTVAMEQILSHRAKGKAKGARAQEGPPKDTCVRLAVTGGRAMEAKVYPHGTTKKQRRQQQHADDGTERPAQEKLTEGDSHGEKWQAGLRANVLTDFLLAEFGGVDALSRGTGVVDVAGGSGHLSMAVGLRGVQCTLIDPRGKAGLVPKRERKAWRRAIAAAAGAPSSPQGALNGEATEKQETHTPPRPSSSAVAPRPFHVINAWFGGRPDGADSAFDGGEEAQSLPACGVLCAPEAQYPTKEAPPLPPKTTPSKRKSSRSAGDSDHDGVTPLNPENGDDDDDNSLSMAQTIDPKSGDHVLAACSVILALHPDEATDAVVDWAVAHRRPFAVVPCCVFSRLFPHRRCAIGPREGGEEEGEQESMKPVNTRQELIAYLRAKHPAIKATTLSFPGANTVLYATSFNQE